MIPFPEIAEQSATGSLRDLYADIRQVTDLPFVNLIYRHLATQQEVLDWTWSALRPHFVSGAFAGIALGLRETVEVMVQALVGSQWRRRSELPCAMVAGVVPVLRSYGLANSLNLVAFTALLRRDALQGHAGSDAVPGGAEKEKLPSLPPLPDLRELGPESVARIHRLNAYADEERPAMVASLYRHLALWPDALAQAETMLQPLQQRGVLLGARKSTVDAVQAALLGQALAMPAAPGSFNAGFRTVVTQFATVTIPKMLPIGMLLQGAMQTPCQPNR